MNKCLNCELETKNKKFCSRSCSTTYNNRLFPKKSKQGICKDCTKVISSSKVYCKQCRPKNYINDNKTLKEIIYESHHRSSAYALVRSRARAMGRLLGFCKCKKCGYDKHFEVCHIKAIKDFDENTLVKVINSEKNIIPLCPNCHWEFDNNLITI